MNLREYALKYGTDKAGFGYTEIYEKYLGSRRDTILSVLEIGIKSGASLRMWESYFPKAKVYGLDINPRSLIYTNRITSLTFDQGAEGSEYDKLLQSLHTNGVAPFDVIIDDGSHWQMHIMKSFEYFFPALKKGGLYFIEDVANEEISLKQGKTWGSKEADFSDAVIKIFEKKVAEGAKNIDIYYAKQPPMTDRATSDFIVIHKE